MSDNALLFNKSKSCHIGRISELLTLSVDLSFFPRPVQLRAIAHSPTLEFQPRSLTPPNPRPHRLVTQSQVSRIDEHGLPRNS